MKTTITTSLSLALLTTPLFACADDPDVLGPDLEDIDAIVEEEAEPSRPLSEIELTINGDPELATINRASVAFLAVDVDPLEVDAIEFYVDGELLAPDVEAPFEAMWVVPDHSADGEHEFAAVAVVEDEALAMDSMVVSVDLPEPGTGMWTRTGGDWIELETTPAGPVLLSEYELAGLDERGHERWRAALPFAAMTMDYQRDHGSMLIAGAVHGDIELARVSGSGEVLWTTSLEGPAIPGDLVLEELVSEGGRLALTGRRELNGEGAAWAAEVELGPEGAELVWAHELGGAGEFAFMGTPAYDESGHLYLPTTRLSDDPEHGWICRMALTKYEVGETIWKLDDESVSARIYAAVAVDSEGTVHLASYDDDGGRVSRFDGEGEWLGANAGLGRVVTALAATPRGVIWAGDSEDNPLVGQVRPEGDIGWQTMVHLSGKQRSRDLGVDELGYVYVLSSSPGGAVIHKLHP